MAEIMSDALKMDLARELGFADVVAREGWGAIRTRDAGNLVRAAVARAEHMLQEQTPAQSQPAQPR